MIKSKGNRIAVAACVFWCLATTAACGPGPYGFSRYYDPADEEKPYDKQAREYAYGVVAANPDEFQDQLIAWFGVVEKIEFTKDGRQLIRLSHNQHKERHLCADDTNSSCRVTVHFNSSGGFSALLSLRSEDLVPGLDKVQPGTLMRIFGRVRCRKNEDEQMQCDYDEQGGILLEGVYYRQWPARYYVTTRAASQLRR
jgi:hypothetical protein